MPVVHACAKSGDCIAPEVARRPALTRAFRYSDGFATRYCRKPYPLLVLFVPLIPSIQTPLWFLVPLVAITRTR
jgi:hypothetical protein